VRSEAAGFPSTSIIEPDDLGWVDLLVLQMRVGQMVPLGSLTDCPVILR